MKKIFSIFFLNILCFSGLIGYAYHVHHMHNPVTHQHILLLSDIHLNHTASSGQREAVLKAAKLMDALLLSEDQLILYSPLEDHGMVSCDGCLQPLLDSLFKDPVHFDQNKNYGVDGSRIDMGRFETTTPIFLLTHCARRCGIKALSVECRQIEMVSTVGWPVSGSVVYKALLELVRQISEYNDGLFLNNYYVSCVNHFNRYIKKYSEFFNYLERSALNLEEIGRKQPCYQCVKKAAIELVEESFLSKYINMGLPQEKAKLRAHESAMRSVENNSESIYDQFLCDLLLFLVDTRTLHYIAMNKHEPVIMVFAGGAHIDEVKEVLEQCGYACLDDSGSQMGHPRALNLPYYFKRTHIGSSMGPIKLFDYECCHNNFLIDFNKNFIDMYLAGNTLNSNTLIHSSNVF